MHFPALPRLLRAFPRFAVLLATLLALAPLRSSANVSIVASGAAGASTYVLGGAAYGQTFDTLPAAAPFPWAQDTTLPGWYALTAAGTVNATGAVINGTASNAADLTLVDVGAASSTDRALTYHTQTTAATHLGLAFTNNSGRALTAFSLSYDAEQWREATTARTVSVAVSYRVGATAADLPSATGWTTLATMGASSTNATVPASLTRSATAVAVDVPAGSTLWIRWTFTNTATTATNSNDILAIDNVSFSAAAAAVDTAPSFTQQPVSRAASLGESVTFTAAASGSPAPTYQWFKGTNASPIAGATSASYTIPSVAADSAGDYFVVATNSVAAVASDTATLTVSTAPVPPGIVTPPAAQTVVFGAPVTFTVVASGTPPLVYQWFKDGTALDGATSASYVIAAAAGSDAGDYTVTVTNSDTGASVTSAPATLAFVFPPAITTQPADQLGATGGSATFTVVASGAGTLTYQWRKDGVNRSGATSATLTLTNLQPSDTGAYDVVVTGSGGSTTSRAASLSVSAPPSIASSPLARGVFVGASTTFSVTAGGTPPLSYQWRRDGANIAGATSSTLTLTNLQLADTGAVFDVVVTNTFGSSTSGSASLLVTGDLPASAFNLQGFATLGSGTTGGGIVAETDASYRKCATPYEFVKAIYDSSKTAGAVRVIEIMNDLDLGYNEVDDATRALGNFRAHATPKLHPKLIATGVSLVDMQTKGGGLTIFSANGATIRHTCLNLKGTSNIILRNLRFDEMWEWDETSKGNYDSNDWDFIDLSNGGVVTNVWIDHCTFTKTYDGIIDFKKGTQYVTLSWCRYVGDDGATNPNSFVRQQVAALEAGRSSRAFYNFLRTNGFSTEDVVQIIQGHDKCHLMGATELDAQNNVLSATFHHQWFENIWDRCVPRLRGGQVHNYNIYVDDSTALVAKRLRDTRKTAMTSSAQLSLENTYSFNPFLNGSISTEGGAILVEKSTYIDCITPLRNNQTDPTNPAYTGKIKSTDSLYVFHNTNGTTTTVRGDSTDAGSPMGPFQAAIIPFSWNTSDGSRPYPAPAMDDPAKLRPILEAGAGAGRLTWPKANWLRTSYVDTSATPPSITAQPAGRSVTSGDSVALVVAANGTAPLACQWYRGAPGDTSNPVGSDSARFTTPAITANTTYWVRITNPAGSVDSTAAALTLATGFAGWASQNGLSGAAAAASADTDGDGVSLLVEYALGLDPAANNAASPRLPVLARANDGSLVFRFTRARSLSDVVYTVETSADLATWTTAAATPVVESQTTDTETIAVTLPTTAPRLFARLRVATVP